MQLALTAWIWPAGRTAIDKIKLSQPTPEFRAGFCYVRCAQHPLEREKRFQRLWQHSRMDLERFHNSRSVMGMQKEAEAIRG